MDYGEDSLPLIEVFPKIPVQLMHFLDNFV